MSADREQARIGPDIQLGPGRRAFSPKVRGALMLILCCAVLVALAIGALLAGGGSKKPVRVVTIPLADRSASTELLRQAEAVGFEPATEVGAGQVEREPFDGAAVSSKSLLHPGTKAPPFRLRTPTGAPVSLASLRGKTVLLEFFATWCPHCAAEAPHLKKLYRSLPRGRYAVVAVNADGEDAPSVLAYHIYFGLPFPALLDPSSHPGTFHSRGSAGPVSRAYRVNGFPTFYVISPDGKIAWGGFGEQPDSLLAYVLHQASAG
jgi:thiol-disulfide isomerase/thioredoxin